MMSGKPLAMVPVSKPSRGKLGRGVRRLLFDFSLYVLIALGIGATTIFYASVGPDEPALLRAIPFFAYTIALFGYLLQTRRRQWRVIGLWYAAAISFRWSPVYLYTRISRLGMETRLVCDGVSRRICRNGLSDYQTN